MRIFRWMSAAVMTTVVAGLLTVPTLSAAASPPASGPGALDTSFGNGGSVSLGAVPVVADSTVVEPDGSIVVAAQLGASAPYTTRVFRLNPNGTQDSSFGTNGSYDWVGAGTAADDPKLAVAEDPQGRVYVTSALPNTQNDQKPDVAVLRLTSGGVPDATWGNSGVVTHNFGGNPNDHGTSVAVDPATGRVYVSAWEGGNGSTQFALLAFTSAGLPDKTFDKNGSATKSFGSGNDTARDIALMPNGDVIVAGFVASASAGDDTGLWLVDSAGNDVASFGTNGTVEADLGNGTNDGARAVAADGSGHIFVSAYRAGVSGEVAAFAADGSALTSFNRQHDASGGSATVSFTSIEGTTGVAGITTDAAGRVLVVGGGSGPGVARFVNDRYAVDTTFADSGSDTFDCAQGGGASAVDVAADEKIVVAGECNGALTVWRVDGSDQVPLPDTSSTDSSGGPLTASGVSVNGGGRTASVSPGASVDVIFSYDVPIQECNPDVSCPIEQLVTGFLNRGPERCENLGAGNQARTLSATETFTAPTSPGRYYIGMSVPRYYGCTANEAGGLPDWAGGGQPWAGDVVPAPASYLAEVIVAGSANLTLTPNRATVPAGAHVTPVSDIPLDALTGTLNDLQAAPLRGSPLRGSPLRGSPLRGSPLRGSPLRGSPLRGSPLRGSPLRGSPIPLSVVPLALPNTWASVLAGTIYANQPLDNVTLQQVLALDPPPAAVASLSLADIDLSRTPLRNVSLVALLLGNTPLANLDAPSGGWSTVTSDDPSTQTLIGLELEGADLSSYYTHGVHVKGKTLVDAPLSGIRLGDTWLDQTPIGGVRLTDVPSTWWACTVSSANPCQTLADAQAGDIDHGLTDAATLGALLAGGTPGVNSPAVPDVTIGQLLPGLLPRDELPYSEISTAEIAAASPVNGPFVTYSATLTVTCDGAATDATFAFTLPSGFRYRPGSGTSRLAGQSRPVTTTVTDMGVNVDVDTTTCSGDHALTTSVQAEPGTVLGPTSDSVSVTFAGNTLTASDSAPVSVVTDSPPTSVALDGSGNPESTLFLGHVDTSGAIDTYTVPTGLPAGTELDITLSHVPVGQDYDLSVFGPGAADLRSSPLRGSPLRGSPLRGSGVDDTTLDPTNDGTTAAPEPQADEPIQPPAGETVWGVSDNRGNGDESVVAIVPDGVSGGITIDVSGYNGSWSSEPFSLLVAIIPPPAPPACAVPNFPFAGQGVTGLAPTTPITGNTQTLILTDQKRLGDLYGAAAASSVMSKLSAFAARSDVSGVVVPVESDPNVQAAFAAWDSDSCSVAKANDVVRAINSYVDRLRGSATGLKYLVLAGGDLVMPMARVQDHVALDNELTYADDEVYSGKDNQLSSSLRAGYLLSDDPYGDFNPIPWLDGQAFVPDVAIGRLVETPSDITSAIDAYTSSNGIRTPSAAFVAGYDFNSDGAQQVANAVTQRVPVGTSNAAINGTWTKTDAVNGMSAAAHGYVSVNAHYDAYRALPASEFTNGTQTQLITTTDLPTSLSNGVLFTIGCHAGLSVADTFIASASESVRQADWPETVARRGGVYAANTGYGYGDSEAVAYSEALMAQYARNLDGSMSVGQALMFAKQAYLHLPLAAVDAKVMEEATFYGLPMYRIGTNGSTANAVVPTTQAVPATTSNGDSGEVTTSFSTANPGRSLTQITTGRGTYYAVKDNGNNVVQPPLSLPGRPLEPTTADVAPPAPPGLVPHGVLVTGLTTHLTGDPIDPVYTAAVPDGSGLTPEPSTIDAFFPATVAGLTERAIPSGGIKSFVQLNPGQFRSVGSAGSGYQQLDDSIKYHVLYSNSDDTTPPTIGTVSGVVTAGGVGNPNQVTFTVTTPSSDADHATVVFLVANSGTTPAAWQSLTLTSSDGGATFTGSAAIGSAGTVEQYIAQLVDANNNVSISSSKGKDFRAHTLAADGAPTIGLDGAEFAGQFGGPVTVSIVGSGHLTYQLDGGVGTPYSGPFVVRGPGAHTVTAGSDVSASSSSTTTFSILDPPPTATISSPVDGGTYVVGATIPTTFSCHGDVTSCTASPTATDTSPGHHTFTVTAKGPGGQATATATYTVSWRFIGFTQPINDPPGSAVSAFKIGSTIPVKFQLGDGNGNLISDAAASALVASCAVQLATPVAAGTVTGTQDETGSSDIADSGKCFRYDATAHQFIYNFSTKTGLPSTATAGQAWLIRAVVFADPPPTSNLAADHSVTIVLK
jgi:uncharacterized delta-60 repeat protein